MSEFATLARPYANALFNVSKEKSLDFSVPLKSMLEIVSNKDFEACLSNPSISNQLLNQFLTEAVDEKNSEFVNFVEILTKNSRLPVLNEICDQYATLMNSINGTLKIKIITAFKLADEQIESLLKKLEAKHKTKFQPEIIIDEALLGGVRIVIGDQVLDGSIRSKVDRLKTSLLT
ncbi:MAG: hypothetical protein CBC60_05475 [Betaproteobacteria bacterium TMED100]|nr:MAG: hypothetical protein CBC60_05475 [Betaproteobacteria bacterium TMED100]|tara:strand:+ start:28 stop:555 length:528 start_codon:yes stop_codon:yes gene_type:complete